METKNPRGRGDIGSHSLSSIETRTMTFQLFTFIFCHRTNVGHVTTEGHVTAPEEEAEKASKASAKTEHILTPKRHLHT